MTSTVVNTYLQDVTENLTGAGDALLVTSAGSVVETQGEIGVYSTGDSETITIDGLVYSAGNDGIAVFIAGSATALSVNGQVQGDVGVVANGAGNSVNVGSQGSIEGVSHRRNHSEPPSFSREIPRAPLRPATASATPATYPPGRLRCGSRTAAAT